MKGCKLIEPILATRPKTMRSAGESAEIGRNRTTADSPTSAGFLLKVEKAKFEIAEV